MHMSDSIRAKVFKLLVFIYLVLHAFYCFNTFFVNSFYTYFYFIHISYIFLRLCHSIYLCKFLFPTFRLIIIIIIIIMNL